MIHARTTLFLLSTVMLTSGYTLELGDLDNLGPGAVPMTLGMLTLLLAIFLPDPTQAPTPASMYPLVVVSASLLMFALTLELGLVPAVVAVTIMASTGHDTSVRNVVLAMILNLVVTVLIFKYLLGMSVSLLPW